MTYPNDVLLKLELEWFYTRADADCGIRSNWGPMVMASLCPGSPGSYQDPNDDFRIRAVDKRRTIEAALFRLSQRQQECLYALYGSVHVPHAAQSVLGDLAGPCLCLTGRVALLRACERKLLGKATEKDRLLFSETRVKAERLQQESFTGYRRQRHAQRED